MKQTYMNTPEPSAMSCGHILVQRLDSLGTAHLSVLLVHIVGAGAGVVADPDTEVLDFEGAFLVDNIQRYDLAIGLLHLAQLHQEIPEAGLGDHSVGCEDAHSVEFGGWVRVGGQVAPDNLVFLEATCESHC